VYRAILFDLGKVLVHFDFKPGYRALEALCPHCAADIPRLIAPTGLVERFETGQVGSREFVSELTTLLSLNADYDRFCEIFSGIFDHTLVPESMLEGLARRYRLVLVSNTNPIHFESIRKNYPMLRHFHDIVLSYQVKALKPQPEIFRAAVERAGCRPEECFYTDDIAEFVAGARRIGIDAVQFQSAEQLARELASRGIQWD
jgi:putative hydrolase of the HAD superfamily